LALNSSAGGKSNGCANRFGGRKAGILRRFHRFRTVQARSAPRIRLKACRIEPRAIRGARENGLEESSVSTVIPLRAQPQPVLWLGAAILIAHIVRGLLPSDLQFAVFERFALVSGGFDRPDTDNMNLLGPIERLFGHMFLHGGFDSAWTLGLLHVGFNLIIFHQAAPHLYLRLAHGPGAAWRLFAIFLAAGLGGAFGFLWLNADIEKAAVGASGAVCGIYAAYLLALRPDWREALSDPFVRQAGLAFVGINVVLAGIITQFGLLPFGIAWEAHLGGMLAGAATYMILAPAPDGAEPLA
jgi:membrane associated rhomboid family serine protease